VIRTGRAVRFSGRAIAGKSKPLRCEIEFDDGLSCEAYVKFPGLSAELIIGGLIAEAVAATLAADLDLPVCEPLIVLLGDLYIDELTYPELAKLVQNSTIPAFGSLRAPDGFREMTASDHFLKTDVQNLLEIYLFDTFLENVDRRLENKNLLIHDREIKMIDHEFCFSRATSVLLGKKPWELGGIVNFSASAHQHVLAPRLRPKASIDVTAALKKWRDLPISHFTDYVNMIPAEWGTEIPGRIRDYLIESKGKIDDFSIELSRVMK